MGIIKIYYDLNYMDMSWIDKEDWVVIILILLSLMEIWRGIWI